MNSRLPAVSDATYLDTTIPAENIEPEVQRRMRIKLIEVPNKFDGYLTESELATYKTEDLRFIIPTRRVAHACEELWKVVLLSNREIRGLEAALIRERLAQKHRMSHGVEIVITAVVSALVSGVIAIFLK